MATIHKCDKCGKTIKGEAIVFSFRDTEKLFFDGWFNNYEFCEKCAKPLAVYVKGFLKANKKYKK
ncbi:hypothetical protein CO116_03155 [Candidatus Falkowbacteria bacterium CG_4_9_14_3_um_filter_38_19]|uniref:Uncharacterized protein n=1 Tax=Candidatus Falkowbacteria bacterium CG_4_9_14_3_um_filter_38_19 TaxID=1974559 RepID=A0A2M8AE63_9BACT|nr:MAG: hypothetical protein CO116_03155 [Candidatus Falkowbacteria bacterium CG_4_9_14_3_um_filter_38_19]